MIIKKVLITGACGYIGRNLLMRLQEMDNFELLLIDNNHWNNDIILKDNTIFENVNLGNFFKLSEIIKKFKPDIIYHFAANINRTRDYKEFESLYQINVIGTLNLLNALLETNYESFIFASTGEVYAGHYYPTCKESDIIIPISPYSITKASAEMVVRNFSELNNKPFTIFRIFNIYGKDMPTHFFLGELKMNINLNEEIKMTKGEQKRDFIYIDDVIDCLCLTISNSNSNNQIFNICTGIGTSLMEVINILKCNYKINIKVDFGAKPYRENEVFDLTGDGAKCLDILKFRPKIDIYEGMKRTFEDYINLTE